MLRTLGLENRQASMHSSSICFFVPIREDFDDGTEV